MRRGRRGEKWDTRGAAGRQRIGGEIGEAIQHEDHRLSAESYHFNTGEVLTVASYDTESTNYHIFTDLESGHRFKIHPNQYAILN
ncbi:MAG: hypothetical protein ACOC3I_04015 [Verrucomicrobiota bacterium]